MAPEKPKRPKESEEVDTQNQCFPDPHIDAELSELEKGSASRVLSEYLADMPEVREKVNQYRMHLFPKLEQLMQDSENTSLEYTLKPAIEYVMENYDLIMLRLLKTVDIKNDLILREQIIDNVECADFVISPLKAGDRGVHSTEWDIKGPKLITKRTIFISSNYYPKPASEALRHTLVHEIIHDFFQGIPVGKRYRKPAHKINKPLNEGITDFLTRRALGYSHRSNEEQITNYSPNTTLAEALFNLNKEALMEWYTAHRYSKRAFDIFIEEFTKSLKTEYSLEDANEIAQQIAYLHEEYWEYYQRTSIGEIEYLADAIKKANPKLSLADAESRAKMFFEEMPWIDPFTASPEDLELMESVLYGHLKDSLKVAEVLQHLGTSADEYNKYFKDYMLQLAEKVANAAKSHPRKK